MNKLLALIIGVIVALIFSFPFLRVVNSFCCLGMVLGGGLAAYLLGRGQGNMLESTQGLRLGAYVGIVTAFVVLLVNLLFRSVLGLLDPVPDYFYAFFEALGEGVVDLADPSTYAESGQPDLWERFAVQLITNTLFGAFGGALAASMFRREPPTDS